ncbi:MAG TPA: SRPBCC family protein [Methanomassiliicoccales archaeon]|nr:SRPBCC family protein [Methanomassiliicoccales archaeon]
MIRTTVSTIVNAPIEEVWDFMVDLRKMILDPSVTDVSWQPPLRIGSVAVITFRQMGVRTARLEVVDMEPNRRLRMVMTAMGSKLDGTYLLEPLDGGKTKLSADAQIEIHGFMRLISPYLSHSTRKDQRTEIARIKRAIESQRH